MTHGKTNGPAPTRAGSRASMTSAAALAAMWIGCSARGQNLLTNASFEWYVLPGGGGFQALGKYPMIGPDPFTIQPWEVPGGGVADVYFPKNPIGSKTIARTPHCLNTLGFPHTDSNNGGVVQSFAPAIAGVGTLDTGFYIFCADIAGDRGTDTVPRDATLGCGLTVNGSPTEYVFPIVHTPTTPLANSTANSIFYPRVGVIWTGSSTYQGISGTFRVWNLDRTGMLVDAVHLFPYVGWDANNPPMAGFSILEDGTWSPSATNADRPSRDLVFGTNASCDPSSEPDTDALTLTSGCGCKSTMIIAATRMGGAPLTTLTITLETEGVSGNTPSYSVSFYDYVKQQWSKPTWGGINNPNANKPYPGGKVASSIQCKTLDWTVYNLSAPLSNYAIPLPDNPQEEIVLAKVVFENGCGKWLCPVDPIPVGASPPPCSEWEFKLHYAAIAFY